MKCARVCDLLLLYAAGELEPNAAIEVGSHLRTCPVCAKRAEELAETEGLLETALCRPLTTPSSEPVLKRVQDLPLPRRPWLPFSPPWRRRRLAAPALAAAVLVALGYVAGQWHAPRERPAEITARRQDRITLSLALLGKDHLEYLANPQPAQIPGPDAHAVAVGLMPLLDFPVAAVDLERDGARLLGGRKCVIHGIAIAFLLYDWEGERVSLYQIDDRKMALPPLLEVQFRGRRFETGEVDGLTCVAWRAGNMHFVMVSGAKQERLLSLARSASGGFHAS